MLIGGTMLIRRRYRTANVAGQAVLTLPCRSGVSRSPPTGRRCPPDFDSVSVRQKSLSFQYLQTTNSLRATDQLTVTPERIGRIEASISFWFLPISVQFYARVNRTESVREVDATWIRMYIGRGSSERPWRRYHAGRGGGAVSRIVDRPQI